MTEQKTVLLAILDGWGIMPHSPTNAVSCAATPNMDKWLEESSSTTLTAHNGMVGLPEGQMGNSEVGHLNLGAGRIVYQDYTRINRAIESGEFYTNPALNSVMDTMVGSDRGLHLFGLLSDGGVHSHIDHVIALLEMAHKKGLKKVYIHCCMDGRDTPPKSGLEYMQQLKDEIKRIGCGEVATVIGRYWAMDRDTRWDRVEKGWQAMVDGQGEMIDDCVQAVKQAYLRDETDEFIAPSVITGPDGEPLTVIKDEDAIISFNFRADRVREICNAFINEKFQGFTPRHRPALSSLVTFTQYERDFNLPIAFPPMSMEHILGEEISRHGLKQLRIAETEKYAHVTYFFNGGREEPYPEEERILIQSPREVATYDLKPEMSAPKVTKALLTELEKQRLASTPYDLVVLNFANCDMVGHTGDLDAAIKAVETVDRCMGEIGAYMDKIGGTMLITADHGNAEIMVNETTGGPYTAHTLSSVPCILVDGNLGKVALRKKGGALRDIAPTILALKGLPIPKEMDGESLLAN
ncbi:MAG: 2,3-bisphosphoglycerate-independent phosphoglycerate mutase [Desulfobulbaceae bacterium]|nr:2,3-bisphosphoglycerate-independent phosphoglycerate mutase [Desulfobulbaceae bacterium]